MDILLINLKYCRNVRAVTITIDSSPKSIDSQDQYSVTVRISGATNATNYLEVSLFKEGTTNYFGETYNGSDWYDGNEGKNYYPIQIVNSSASATLLFKVGNPSLTQYPGPDNYKLKVRRHTSSGNLSETDTQTPADVNISYIPQTPVPTDPPAQVAYKSTYKINKPKDPIGKDLSGIQIYVDGAYIHHEDEEILYFFNGHECYTGIDCSLGTHTISLRKSGYVSWEDTQNFSAGSNFEVNPVLDKLESLSPTASPTVSPTPTKTPKPTPTKTPTPTDLPASESAVLGIKEEIFTPLPSPPSLNTETDRRKTPFLPILFIIAGLSFIAVPIFSIIRNGKKDSEIS